MTPLLVATGVAVVAGAALQAATGFGFALLAAPLVFAALDPHEAIGLLLLLGIEIGVLTLATEGRRPRAAGRAAARSCSPGRCRARSPGVAVLRALDAVTLQIAVSVGVAATLLVRRRAPAERSGPEPRWAAPATGLSAGALVDLDEHERPAAAAAPARARRRRPSRCATRSPSCYLGLSADRRRRAGGDRHLGRRPARLARRPLFVPARRCSRTSPGAALFARLAASDRYEPRAQRDARRRRRRRARSTALLVSAYRLAARWPRRTETG